MRFLRFAVWGFTFVLHIVRSLARLESRSLIGRQSAVNRAMPGKKRAHLAGARLVLLCAPAATPWCFTCLLPGPDWKERVLHLREYIPPTTAKSRAMEGFLVERSESARGMFPELEEVSEAESRNIAEFLRGHTHRLCCLDSPWWLDSCTFSQVRGAFGALLLGCSRQRHCSGTCGISSAWDVLLGWR